MEEKVLEVVKLRGPTLPIDVAKAVGMETLLVSAILSTLIGRGSVKITHRKIGSSPLYYTEGQEQKVWAMLYSELNELEKKAIERLKELRVAFKDDLYPQERVLLSELKDFASHLSVKKDETEHVCWKHYSVTDDEFDSILKSKFDQKAERVEQQIEIPQETETQGILQETKSESIKLFEQKPEIKKRKVSKETLSAFDSTVQEYLKKSNVEVLDKNIGKTESNYVASVPTPFGNQNYFIIAKNKSSISEADISKIYVECSSKKYPALLIVPKQLSKKVKSYVEKNFGNLIKIVVLEK